MGERKVLRGNGIGEGRCCESLVLAATDFRAICAWRGNTDGLCSVAFALRC